MPTPPMPATASERRRQWFISHGLLSPSSGPSRRLGGLLPRVGTRGSSRSAEVDLRMDDAATPVVVARADTLSSRAPRAASMPSEEAAGAPALARAASTRVGQRDRPASPPRRRLFGRRRGRARREERKMEGRQVIRVVDRQLPKKVLQGAETKFDGTKWKRYEEKIDGLKEDRGFIEYLTEGVAERSLVGGKDGVDEAQQLAVNKLYPLAFIRLLEAQAKYQKEESLEDAKEEKEEKEEEKHRYDDLDRDDEAAVVRTASSGIYDRARFRAVGGGRRGRGNASDELVRLLQGGKDRRMERGLLIGSMGRAGRVASVPVC